MNEYLFSYGTLQKNEVQLELFGRLLSGVTDILRGYKLSTIEIQDGNFLAKGEETSQLTVVISDDKAARVEGMVFELSREEMLVADRYEPAEYIGVKIVLESGKQAWIYLAA